MPPLTLAILASVLQMQGADAQITSDNKGVDELLAAIRGQLQEQVDPASPRVILADYNKNFGKTAHEKGTYLKKIRGSGGNIYSAKPAGGGTATKPQTGGTHR
jgi:hypothetical protein